MEILSLLQGVVKQNDGGYMARSSAVAKRGKTHKLGARLPTDEAALVKATAPEPPDNDLREAIFKVPPVVKT